ncbi:stalk domain-containing protein [Chengkuizengella axinellae]|uniref:Stalk domain-containing protein n=1 Tax=Chengkuizengella axinellae TaxID=3064388 RepID=A0ABT9ITQ8_9BACL|nr:stalk domain-containing protein [Chengkuizengella sp. 2205SS18-9]MDP5272718.1 stalk domain-containing protein [Chengkuizengella sp. 2205SS18-9]
MKKTRIIFSMIILSLIFSATAIAEEDTKIQVWIDGEQIQFEEAPFSENGTTLVPFRVLFSELGLNVLWDQETKTVTGINDNIKVELTLNSNEAIVNGETIQLLVAPQLVNNSTFVPLRFVGESTGANVQWDGATKTISIISPLPEVNDEELILELFDRYLTATNDRDLDGFLEVFNEQYEVHNDMDLEEVYSYAFEEKDIETTMEELEIIEIDNNEAIVFAIEVYERVDGGFYIDNRQEIIYTLHKNKDGLWQISEDEILVYEKINLDKLKEINAEISSKDEKEIMKVFESFTLAYEKGDAELFVSNYHEDSIIFDDSIDIEAFMEMIFENVEYSYDIDHTSIVQKSDENNIKFLAIYNFDMTFYDDSINETVTEEVENVYELFHFKKADDGSWKIYFVETIHAESDLIEE